MVRLAALLKENFGDNIIHIHCFAHCNELAFKDATALSPLIAEAQDLCEDLYVLVGVSPKRVLFENIQKEMGDDSDALRLKNLSRTRWTTKGSAVVLIKKTRELQEALEILSKDPTVSPECRAKSRGMLDKIRSVRPMFQVVVMHELANLLENNSRNLQSSSLTAEQAVYGIKKMLVRLQEMRSTEEFQRLYDQTIKLADLRDENETQKSKRHKSAPRHLSDYFAHSSSPSSVIETDNAKELLRICYEAVDSLVEALQKRFRHENLETLQAIETCLLKAVNKELSLQEVRPQLKGLPTGISIDTLVEQLAELPVMLKLYNAECVLPIKKVTKLSTLCEIFNHRESTKQCILKCTKC